MPHATLNIPSGEPPPPGFFGKVGDLPGTLFVHQDENPPHALLYSWGKRNTPDFVFHTPSDSPRTLVFTKMASHQIPYKQRKYVDYGFRKPDKDILRF